MGEGGAGGMKGTRLETQGNTETLENQGRKHTDHEAYILKSRDSRITSFRQMRQNLICVASSPINSVH